MSQPPRSDLAAAHGGLRDTPSPYTCQDGDVLDERQADEHQADEESGADERGWSR